MRQLLDPKQWDARKISYTTANKKTTMDLLLRVIPGTHGRIGFDMWGQKTPYWFNSTMQRWCRVKDGVFALLRAFNHIDSGYQYDEIPTLEDLLQVAQTLNIEFLDLQDPKTATKIKQELSGIAKTLYGDRDEAKVETREQATLCLMFRDKKGRMNVGAFRARTVAMMDRLVLRLATVTTIEPLILQRVAVVQNLVNTLHFLVCRAEQSLMEAERRFDWKGAPERKLVHIISLIEQAEHQTDQLVIRPYRGVRRLTLSDCAKAKKFCYKKSWTEARAAIAKARKGLAVRRLLDCIEAIHLRICLLEHAHGKDSCRLQECIPELTNVYRHFNAIQEGTQKIPIKGEVQLCITWAIQALQRNDGLDAREALRRATRTRPFPVCVAP